MKYILVQRNNCDNCDNHNSNDNHNHNNNHNDNHIIDKHIIDKNITNNENKLKRKRSKKDISKYKGDIVCPYCGGIRINKFGKRGNKQKYICRDCRRVFITEEDSRKKYSEDFKLNALKWYMERVSIRGIERRLGVSDTTIIRWIREKGKIVKNKLLESVNNINNNKYNISILEIDENEDRILEKLNK